MSERQALARRTAALVLGLAILRLVYLVPLDVLPDEADNFIWSQHLALGYYDQPPLLMWLLAAAHALLGHRELAVRLVPAVLGVGAAWYLFRFGCDLVGSRRAFLWVACLHATPLFFGGSMFATPDAPMIFCLAGATCHLRRGLVDGATRSWVAAGVLAGLALLSKFVAVLTIAAFFLCLLLPEHRRWLGRKEPWLALALSALTFLPVVAWNLSNDWVAFAFQWSHGLGTGRFPRWIFLPEYLGLQTLVAGPLPLAAFLAAMAHVAWRWRSRTETQRFLWCLAIVPFAVFLCSSLLRKAEANWPCYSYLPGLLLAAILYEERARRAAAGRLAWRAGWALNVAALAVVLLHIYRPILPVATDRAAEFGGWRQLGSEAARLARANPGYDLAANRYQTASELGFYSGMPVLCLNIRNRPNQYDLWQDRSTFPGRRLLFFHDRPPGRSRVFADFSEVREVATLSLSGPGRPVARTIYVFAVTMR